MSFQNAFDALTRARLDEQATELLYSWIIYRERELYAELRARPPLKFWSQHPGNPDFYSNDAAEQDREGAPGWAYLLTGSADVQQALDELSMRPYESWDSTTKKEQPWVLSMNDLAKHTSLRDAMHKAMIDSKLPEKMGKAVQLHWNEAKTDLAHIDVRQYFRRVALSFTGFYFGIPPSLIFEKAPLDPQRQQSPSGIENLEQWSGEGYENFIWKIHARHFDQNMPPLNDALYKIGFLVAYMSFKPIEDTVIERFLTTSPLARLDTLRNIIGMIQGLVDNMMTSACLAFNQLIANNRVKEAADLDVNDLVRLIRELQATYGAPSPFLPRFGEVVNTKEGQQSLLEKYSYLQGSNIVCATGAAMTDPNHPKGTDIRLGYGLHECIGRDLGDQLTARALHPLLQLGSLQTVRPLTKKWGWIPQQYVVAADHPQRRNQVEIDRVANAAPPRPYPYSLWSSGISGVSDYVSWPALTDKTYSSRHLPPASDVYKSFLQKQVPVDTVSSLFERPTSGMVAWRSTLLFCFFAQWLIDSFLRTDPTDRRRTTSNHQLDLCQIYGLNESTTRILRSGIDGKMKSETFNGREFPPRLFDGSGQVRLEFQGLPYVVNGQLATIIRDLENSEVKLPYLCASGLERGNSTVGYTALNTLFLREHNRICGLLKARESAKWDDERLFQTVRMIMIVLEIKIIIEEYINHINTDDPTKRPFSFDPDYLFAERRHWYRTNWMSVEFDLLYRWHSLVPDTITFAGQSYTPGEFRGNNEPLFKSCLGDIFNEASKQPAGKIQLFNSPRFLWPAERAAVAMARNADLRPFNEYRERFGIPPIQNFKGFGAAGPSLQKIYGDVDKVEFLPGIFAEAPWPNSGNLFGTTMMTMVGYDAFTHALTNPLLSQNVLNAEHLTQTGMDIIKVTSKLDDLLKRNGETGTASFD